MSVGQVLAGVVLGALALGMRRVGYFIRKKEKQLAGVNDHIKETGRLRQQLYEIRTYYDADRVELYQFHNGDHYVSGASIQKVSMTHFVMAKGISVPVEARSQNVPLGYVSSVAESLLKKEPVFFSYATLLAGDSYFKSILRYGGARSALVHGVFDPLHNMIGFLVVMWLEDVTLTQEQIDAMKEFALGTGDEMQMGKPPA